jgi:CheY-like chemotaxis protein/Tfp pilus assembly protein PilZ
MSAIETPAGQQDAGANQQIIVVVDARPLRQFYTSIFLQRSKYQVIMAKTAKDAQLFLGLTVPRAVIADHDLPDMSGLELLKRMRQDHRTRNVPFIIYTANRDPDVRRACEAAGCAAYLIHPMSLEALYAAVQKATQAKPRNFVRLATAINVVVGDDRSAGILRQDLIIAISEQGMFVSTNTPLEHGRILIFTFHLPNAPGWFFRIEGQVLYAHSVADKRKLPGMAVKFLTMSDQERQLLKDFIKQKLMEGIAPDPPAEG